MALTTNTQYNGKTIKAIYQGSLALTISFTDGTFIQISWSGTKLRLT